MGSYTFTKGKDIKLKGAAGDEVSDVLSPRIVAIQPPDFRGLKPRLAVAEGDSVKMGTPVITDKEIDGLCLVSPVSGKVKAINRGLKRALLSVVIENDGKNTAESFPSHAPDKLAKLKKAETIQALLKAGLWPAFRQRPFSKIASPKDEPKSIFVHAVNTEPLAADMAKILDGKEKFFQAGLDVLTGLTAGKVHVCAKSGAKPEILTNAKGVECHTFSGPHPAGNVSTLIQAVDPINKGDIVWYVEAQEVARIGRFFLEGTYPQQVVVALTGEGCAKTGYARTVQGAAIKELLPGTQFEGKRCITGSVLAGREIGADGFIGFYDTQISVVPEGGHRELLGWLMPGAKKYTLSHTYLSAFLPEQEASLDTDENGGHRAIVLNDTYDKYINLDIVTYFLLKAVIAGDIDEAERLGILECDAEDFALCSFACPSKVNVGAIIRRGLDVIEKEG